MDIRNRRALRRAASEALAANPGDPRRVVLAYLMISALSTLLAAVAVDLLEVQINQATGLANLGTRSILTTIGFCLPLAQTVCMWYIELGYLKTTVAMARRQAVQPRDLMEGFRFFGPYLRAGLIQGMIYMMLSFLATQAFMLLPYGLDCVNLVNAMVLDPDALTAAMADPNANLPLLMLPVWLVLFGIAAGPFFYSCRMVNYVLLERPGTGALMAIGESGKMMLGNRLALLKLDLGFWWFYLAQFLLGGVLYGDKILPLLGVELPWSATVSYYMSYAAYFLLASLLFWFFLNRIQTTYATAYDALRPRPQESQSGGAVLGNIFDLARDYKED